MVQIVLKLMAGVKVVWQAPKRVRKALKQVEVMKENAEINDGNKSIYNISFCLLLPLWGPKKDAGTGLDSTH